jgi:aminoglycoside 6-adenylyltransferase
MAMKPSLEQRLINWATDDPNVRGMLLIGSRAQESTADQLADYDITLFTQNPSQLTADSAWFHAIGPVAICVKTARQVGERFAATRLVIYEDGQKVDYTILGTGALDDVIASGDLVGGFHVLLDKDNNLATLPEHLQREMPPMPTQQEFTGVVEEFWFEIYHVTKYLAREERWMARVRECAVNEFLLTMIEWHSRARHGRDLDTHYLGKRITEWASPDVLARLPETYSGDDPTSAWAALDATCQLFRDIARETATRLTLTYPDHPERTIVDILTDFRPEKRN